MNADSVKARLKNFAVKNANDQRAITIESASDTTEP